MSLFQSNYIGSSLSYPDAEFGLYPNFISLQLGLDLYLFPANFNPTGLGSATPQDFADSLANQINIFLALKLGAGNFTPVTATYSTDGTNGTIQTNDFNIKDAILFQPNGSSTLLGFYDKEPTRLNQSFALGIFSEMIPAVNADGESCINHLLNCPKSYDHEIWNRLRNNAG